MRAALLALMMLLLAGCTSPSDTDPTPTETPDGSGLASGGTTPAAAEEEPLPDLELFNDTLDFAAPNGGSASEESLTQPEGYGNVTVVFQIYGECPVGYAAERPRLVLSVDGSETVLWEHVMIAPNEPFTCPIAGGGMDRERDGGTVIIAMPPGEFVLQTLGQFTGEADVAVTATA